MITGSCVCGRFAFEVDEPLQLMTHCRYCQFQLPGAQRFGNSFCGHCGGPVPRELPGTASFLVPAGALDDDPGLRPQAHIYTASKAPWFDITDGLPQFEELPPS
jgi:hypothetical protein